MELFESEAKNGLLLLYLASQSNIEGLRYILNQKCISCSNSLQILLKFIPETIDPPAYLPLVFDVVYDRLSLVPSSDGFDLTVPEEIQFIDEESAKNLFDSLIYDGNDSEFVYSEDDQDSSISSWIISRSNLIDDRLGALNIVDDLLCVPDVIKEYPKQILPWKSGVLSPLRQYISCYPDSFDTSLCKLRNFTTSQPETVISFLLSNTATITILRDVTTMVVPYIEYSGINGHDLFAIWTQFLTELVNISRTNFRAISELIKSWSGPLDNDEILRLYVSATIACCYACRDNSPESFEFMHVLHKKSVKFLTSLPKQHVNDLAIDLNGSLRRPNIYSFPESPLFTASTVSLDLLDKLITSVSMISIYIPTMLCDIADLRLFGSHTTQLEFLSKLVRGTSKEYAYRDDSNWRTLRSGARWLQNKSGVLGALSQSDIENTFLSALLEFGRIALVREIYIDPMVPPLNVEEIAEHVLASFQKHYDNASNCNTSRGSLKTASQV